MSKSIKIDGKITYAKDFPNKIKNFDDGFEYVSKLDKNKVFKWYKIKSILYCNSPEKYYMQFPENYLQKKFNKYNNKSIEKKLNTIKKILKKKNIYLLKMKWAGNYNYIDNAWFNAEKIIMKKIKNNNIVSRTNILKKSNFIFYTENSFFWSQNTGKLTIQWNLHKDSKKIVFDLLKKKFNKKFIMPKSISKAIIIKL
jgi:hypothetical protein